MIRHCEEKDSIVKSMAFSTTSEGPYSYSRQSANQKRGIEFVLPVIREEISENFNARQLLSSSSHFTIADLGCSTGPNTFFVVDSIREAVVQKFQSEGLNPEELETQVLFNDQVTNDFNALFTSLPGERRYYVAGVPGSFYDRLFPKSSVHFLHSSYALQWLSRVPTEVTDRDSEAWNKGLVVYRSKEVEAAYTNQFVKDMSSFLAARSVEMVQGGMLALLLPFAPDGAEPSECMPIRAFHHLGSALMDMVKTGLVEEDKVDAFNFPIYCPPWCLLQEVIDKNGNFTICRKFSMNMPPPPSDTLATDIAKSIRAVVEKTMSEWFGGDIMDELFERYVQKIREISINKDSIYDRPVSLLVILRRK